MTADEAAKLSANADISSIEARIEERASAGFQFLQLDGRGALSQAQVAKLQSAPYLYHVEWWGGNGHDGLEMSVSWEMWQYWEISWGNRAVEAKDEEARELARQAKPWFMRLRWLEWCYFFIIVAAIAFISFVAVSHA